MRVYLFRHADAAPRGSPGYPDDGQRPLTAAGRAQARAVAAGLLRLKVRPDLIVSSPLRRALETAEEAARVWDGCAVEMVEALQPETPPRRTSQALTPFAARAHLVLVGHEPHMSAWLAELVAPGGLRCDFKKAGVACVEIAQVPPPAGSGTLRWFMAPKILEKLG